MLLLTLVCVFEGQSIQAAAVAQIFSPTVKGVVRMVQLDAQRCFIEGTVDGLSGSDNRLKVHELGDLSRGCERYELSQNVRQCYSASVGNTLDGGDLGVLAVSEGRGQFKAVNTRLKVSDLVGRSIVVHSSSAKQPRYAPIYYQV